jgi:hypothetical protein
VQDLAQVVNEHMTGEIPGEEELAGRKVKNIRVKNGT